MRITVLAILCLITARLGSGGGLTIQTSCTLLGGFYEPFNAPQNPFPSTCGAVSTNGAGGSITANATMSGAYSNTGMLTNTVTDSVSVVSAAQSVAGNITSEFSDMLTIFGGTGTAYLSVRGVGSGPVLSGFSVSGAGFGVPAACRCLYEVISFIAPAGNEIQFTYGQPINLTVDFSDTLPISIQSESFVGELVTGSETLTDTLQLELLVTSSPYHGAPVIFEPLPAVTIESAQGISYAQIPVEVAPEPAPALMFAIGLLVPVCKKLYNSRG
jgi:hypothetical protein